jgi:hypothetical protein
MPLSPSSRTQRGQALESRKLKGRPGKSFDVNLTTGVFCDFADGGKAKTGAINLWMEVKRADFKTARDKLRQWLGMPATNSSASKRATESKQNGVFDWTSLQALNAGYRVRLAEWRGFSPEFVSWLVSADLVRIIEPLNDVLSGRNQPSGEKVLHMLEIIRTKPKGRKPKQ